MGMLANYQLIEDDALKALEGFNFHDEDNDALLEFIESQNESAEVLLDIDKMWDVMHFIFTGVDSSAPIENDPLSEAVVGEIVYDTKDFISFTSKERVAHIVEALEEFDIHKALEEFSMQKCKEAKLYPNIWDYKEEEDEIKEEIEDVFYQMLSFYREVLEKGGNVLVTIY